MSFATATTKVLTIATAGICVSAAYAESPKMSMHPAGSVLKVKLDQKLESKTAHVGDTFTATLDTGKSPDYFDLPKGTKVSGHVESVRAKAGKTPGQLQLAVDDVILPDGSTTPISASMMKMDKSTVMVESGRYMAKSYARGSSTNYVATGAAVGAIAAAVTGGDLLAGGILGAAIGFLIGQSQGPNAQDITIKPGTTFAVRFDQQATFLVDQN